MSASKRQSSSERWKGGPTQPAAFLIPMHVQPPANDVHPPASTFLPPSPPPRKHSEVMLSITVAPPTLRFVERKSARLQAPSLCRSKFTSNPCRRHSGSPTTRVEPLSSTVRFAEGGQRIASPKPCHAAWESRRSLASRVKNLPVRTFKTHPTEKKRRW